MQLSSLLRIYLFPLPCNYQRATLLTFPPRPRRVSWPNWTSGATEKSTCLLCFRANSDLEAFKRHSERGSPAALTSQSAALTRGAAYVFLSY